MSIGLATSRLLREIETSIKDDLAHTILRNQAITAIYTLMALYEKDKQRPMDLAKAVNVAVTSFTPVLDQLETAGLIDRCDNPDDRRSILVSLTKDGKALKNAIENAIGNAEVRYGGG